MKEGFFDSPARYYRIAEITIRVESEIPVARGTFRRQIELFRESGPGDDTVTIRHHFKLPDLRRWDLGLERYRRAPWAIYQQGDNWTYLGISPQPDDPTLHRVASFNKDHTHAEIFNSDPGTYLEGDLHSLTLFPSDQILIARLLADRNGCYLHSAGAILDGAGWLFVGHSGAGKSTMTRLLLDAGKAGSGGRLRQVEILCDDRNIVRRWNDGWRVYGTWSHGDVSLVSQASAPLEAICFIEQADENSLSLLTERKEILRRLLACLIRPFVTAAWWHKTIDIVEHMSREVPCHVLRFDRSGAIAGIVRDLTPTKIRHSQ